MRSILLLAGVFVASCAASGGAITDCADCPDMVVIPAGSYLMGSAEAEAGRQPDEGPQRSITFARPFAIGRTEVTVGQYAAFAAATGRAPAGGCVSDRDENGSMEADPLSTWRDPGFAQTDDHPVVCVNWDDAEAYVQWLSARTGERYRLPSEAEWEYAARAGSVSPYPWGETASREYGNYGAETCCSRFAEGRDQWLYTAPVSSFPANAWGLSDMHGNVGEWVADCYTRTLENVPADGGAYVGGSCENRSIRTPGGSFGGQPAWMRSAHRSGDPQTSFRNTNVGFRVARDVS